MGKDFADILSGLPDVAGGSLKAVRRHSVSGIMRALKSHRCVTDAGDNGSITIYRDDAGRWRGFFHVFQTTVSETNVDTKAALRKWLIDWSGHV